MDSDIFNFIIWYLVFGSPSILATALYFLHVMEYKKLPIWCLGTLRLIFFLFMLSFVLLVYEVITPVPQNVEHHMGGLITAIPLLFANAMLIILAIVTPFRVWGKNITLQTWKIVVFSIFLLWFIGEFLRIFIFR